MKTIYLRGEIYSDYYGIRDLNDIFHELKAIRNQTVKIDFSQLNWIDANLSAILNSILFRLINQNKLKFVSDINKIKSDFDVLIRNGLFQIDENIKDNQESTVCLSSFLKDEEENFIEYISNDLMNHRGLIRKHDSSLKDKIESDLIEIFTNFGIHARTDYPIFVCGQFYPEKGELIFTMVDLGIGFYIPINEKVGDSIDNSKKAINWAIQKHHTSKKGEPGGLGLSGILDYCNKNNGVLSIVSGNTYWASDNKGTIFEEGKEYSKEIEGTIINLSFKKK